MSLPDVSTDEIPKHYAGDLSTFQPVFLQGKLDEAVDMISSRYGDVVLHRLASGKLSLRFYQTIVVRIASRVFNNPDGFDEENEGGYGYKVNASASSGTMWLTDDDIADLTGKHPRRSDGSAVLGTASVGRHIPGGGW